MGDSNSLCLGSLSITLPKRPKQVPLQSVVFACHHFTNLKDLYALNAKSTIYSKYLPGAMDVIDYISKASLTKKKRL